MTTDMNTSDYDQTEYSRDLQISSAGRDHIETLQEFPNSVFAEADMKGIYVLAAAYGYRHNQFADANSTGSEGIVARKALSNDQQAVLESIAVAHEDTPMVLNDKQLAAEIAQRYALRGLETLIEHYEDADDPREELISDIAATQ